MNFSEINLAPGATRRSRAGNGVLTRVRNAVLEATRSYCERLVQRALMIDPAADDRMTVDVHFCDVR